MSGREIVFDRAGVDFGGMPALSDVSVRLDEQRIAVIGSNGSGKSTFARLLNALTRPTSGTVRVHGLDTIRQQKELRRRVGFVFSNPDAQIIMPTVAEDVAYSLRGNGLSKTESAGKVEEALHRFGLTELRDAPAHLLSGGQKQLLSLCAVLVSGPSLVVADEPTALLDAVNSRRMERFLLEEMDQQLVLVTHDLRLAARCDVALRFESGALVDRGEPGKVIARYEEAFA